ncbi:DUF397 domain-containing protein [Streptomyces sp. NPDC052236]|uniref:DUF397 domain-containing protein n=1 Tax=Streptomyces sp. NPDC052236 TaxID=3365686 RepID=UPI0037CCD9B8
MLIRAFAIVGLVRDDAVVASARAEPRDCDQSSFSGGGDSSNCVELTAVGKGILLRESDEPSHVLFTTPAGLAALLREVKALSSGRP